MRPFGSPNKKNPPALTDENSDDEEEADDPEEQIQLMTHDTSDTENEDEVEEVELQSGDAALAAELIDNDEIELEVDDISNLSDEEDNDRYTSQSCKESLAKFHAIARKLNKSPNSKALFAELCGDHECSRPHNIPRDVRTRWNSTLAQLSSILRCSAAIFEWQRDKRHGLSRIYHINQEDLDLASDLVEVLQPFYEITLQVSTRGAARISDIVVFIDQITGHLSSAILEKRENTPRLYGMPAVQVFS
ncbi:hypothetical protein PGTUg99_023747 [Puccinia graminis f. sp. tritici]|uniref:Uncharacterized protein n=1 Tax=Puccinia graminis f. sp. tritici TaxID=56615 RepID=A0A5B0S5T7_PUCGR|nr:hypothetical protein PGTUg99_023747 [Puccinia graminis f. sp. tritici]